MEKQEHRNSKKINAKGFYFGFVLLLIGCFLLMRNMEIFPNLVKYWPILLIVVGIMIISFGLCFPNSIKRHQCYARDYQHDKNSGYFHRSSVFSEGTYVISDPIFSGGDISGVFGSITIDLRKTNLAENVDTILRIHAVFGEVKICVPENWNVICQINSAFGNFADRRINIMPIENGKRLIIEGECIFGGGMLQSL